MNQYQRDLIEQSQLLSEEEKQEVVSKFEEMSPQKQKKLLEILEKEQQTTLRNQTNLILELTKQFKRRKREKVEEIFTDIANKDLEKMLHQI